MPGRLAGKVCIVTGTGGGMGRAAALLFATEGALVVGCDLDENGARTTVAEVKAAGGEMISLEPCDLTQAAACTAVVELAIGKWGRIDVLYNNAAKAYFGWLDEQSLVDWHRTFDHEVHLVHLMTRTAWPHLVASSGTVVNVASVCAWTTFKVLPGIAHSAAKGAIVAMTRHQAMEGRLHGIRVNSISPGLIETLQTAPQLADPVYAEHMLGRIMTARPGRPEEVAAAALFLASDEASYITGADLRVDGGMTAW